MARLHLIVTGLAGHGKDSVGLRLAKKFGYQIVGFADAIKEEVAARYRAAPVRVDRAYLDDRQMKNVPQAALALQYCADEDFVLLALDVFADEDRQLLALPRRARDDATGPLGRAIAALAALTRTVAGRPPARTEFTRTERLALPRSSRRITQVYGTEYRRLSRFGHELYWIDIVRAQLAASQVPMAICGGRSPQELTFARESHYPRLHVVRPGHGEVGVVHETERIPPPDADTIVLINDGTLDDMDPKIDHVMVQLLAGVAPAAVRMQSSAPAACAFTTAPPAPRTAGAGATACAAALAIADDAAPPSTLRRYPR